MSERPCVLSPDRHGLFAARGAELSLPAEPYVYVR